MTGITAFVGATTVTLVLATLLVSGVGHVLRPTSLRDALQAQGVTGPFLSTVLAASAISGELAIGAIGGVSALLGSSSTLRVAMVAAASLLTVYGLWTFRLVSSKRQAPCGCMGSGSASINMWVPARAFFLAAAAVIGLLTTRTTLPLIPFGGFDAPHVIAILAAAGFGLAIWLLPGAMSIPSRSSLNTARIAKGQQL